VNYTGDQDLPDVSDEDFQKARETLRPYTAVVLRPGPAFERPGPDRTQDVTATIMAHGKRNYALHRAGLMPIVCPVADGSDVVGLSLFDADPDEVDRIMANDPAVQADIVAYEIHPTWSFPGSTLP
jgi:hypothetical protein